MTFVPNNWTGAKAAINEIVEDVTRITEAKDKQIEALQNLAAQLSQMSAAAPAGWSGAIAFINAQATAEPSNAAWQSLKAEADEVVSDFLAERAALDAVNAAIAGV